MSISFAVIGGGNMARAIIEGAITGGVLPADTIVVADPEQSSRDFFAALGCQTTPSASLLPETRHVLLSVKPQIFDAVASDVTADIVYSIMAGVTIEKIAIAIGNNRIVRMMPNLPCSIGYGATGLAISDSAQDEDAVLAKEIFSQLGSVIEVSEHLMDAVTAVSGSGPAYVFLLAEAMVKGGVQAGLDNDTSDALVRQTILGAAALLLQDERSAEELRQAVTSKGGTTAAALHVMNERHVCDAIVEAVIAARDRGRELDGSDPPKHC
jgi:pyrroline-5-carboxylate reductase